MYVRSDLPGVGHPGASKQVTEFSYQLVVATTVSRESGLRGGQTTDLDLLGVLI